MTDNPTRERADTPKCVGFDDHACPYPPTWKDEQGSVYCINHKYLPAIVGRLTFPIDASEHEMAQFKREVSAAAQKMATELADHPAVATPTKADWVPTCRVAGCPNGVLNDGDGCSQHPPAVETPTEPMTFIDRSYASEEATAIAYLVRLLRRVHHGTMNGTIDDRERCWQDVKNAMRPSIVQQAIADFEGGIERIRTLEEKLTAVSEGARIMDAAAERTIARLQSALTAAEKERASLRVRMFGCGRSERSDHTTACTIWGDDGKGGTPENFPELPCNCGAIENFLRSSLHAAEEKIAALNAEREAWLRASEPDLGLNVDNHCTDADCVRDTPHDGPCLMSATRVQLHLERCAALRAEVEQLRGEPGRLGAEERKEMARAIAAVAYIDGEFDEDVRVDPRDHQRAHRTRRREDGEGSMSETDEVQTFTPAPAAVAWRLFEMEHADLFDGAPAQPYLGNRLWRAFMAGHATAAQPSPEQIRRVAERIEDAIVGAMSGSDPRESIRNILTEEFIKGEK